MERDCVNTCNILILQMSGDILQAMLYVLHAYTLLKGSSIHVIFVSFVHFFITMLSVSDRYYLTCNLFQQCC